MTQTLLRDFIERKLELHHDPSRKGTKKVDLIGLTRVKLQACLLYGLTDLNQKEIALSVGKSHDLVRKWCTEAQFNSYRDIYRNLFISEVGAKLRGNITTWDPAKPKAAMDLGRLREAIARDKNGTHDSELDALFADASVYSSWIQDELLDWSEGLDDHQDWPLKKSLELSFAIYGIRYSRERIRLKLREAQALYERLAAGDELSPREHGFINRAFWLADEELKGG